jgi:outer membrane protein OmpA-like peptidoglycan-associated protein/tetratricopeptide (TPR) repeat protein
MKRILPFSIGLLMLGFTALNAQNKQTRKADSYFQNYDLVDAAQEYLKLAQKNPKDDYVIKQLADTYFLMFKNEEASKWYKEAMAFPQDAETHFNYAQVLKSQGKNEEFMKQMNIFVQKTPNDPRAIAFLSSPNYLEKLEAKVSRVELAKVSANSGSTDFGAFINKNEFYFTSNRPTRKKNRVNNMTGDHYYNVFVAEFANGKIEKPTELSSLNSRLNDGNFILLNDNKALYASSTANINIVRDKQKRKYKSRNFNRLMLFTANRDAKGRWSDFEALPFCDIDYTYESPAISPDGMFLYFASNMPGSYGGLDLWRVAIGQDGSFGTPQNLGPSVNTAFDESYPFVAEDNATLYFSSKGHFGFGGYDIFSISMGVNQKPENIGRPLNSEKDDFAYYHQKEIDFTVISSNRDGNSNLFQIVAPDELDLIAEFLDPETKQPIAGATVEIIDAKGNVMQSLVTDEKGQIKGYIPSKTKYKVRVNAEGYETYETKEQLAVKGKQNIAYAPKRIPAPSKFDIAEFKPADVLFAFDRFEIDPEFANDLDVIAKIMTENPDLKIEIVAHTDNRGSNTYNKRLSQKRGNEASNYLKNKGVDESRIQVKAMGEDAPKINCKSSCSEEDHAENRRVELILT